MGSTFVALLIVRLGVGLTVASHGAQKLFGWFGGPGPAGFGKMVETQGLRPGRAWATAVGICEFAGGLGLALGLLTPASAFAVVAVMVSAIVMVHLDRGFFNTKGGMEFPLVVGIACLGLALAGGGDYSLDKALGITFPQPLTFIIGVVVVGIGSAVMHEARLSELDKMKSRVAPLGR